MALSSTRIKYIRSLHHKKYRQKYSNFIVEGDKINAELIQNPHWELESLLALPDWLSIHEPERFISSDLIISITNKELERISAMKTPNKVISIVKQKAAKIDGLALNNDLAFYLDGIQDPGNLGTIIRTADWFGIETIYCSKKTVDCYNTKVIQASMGAFLRVNCVYCELEEIKIYGRKA